MDLLEILDLFVLEIKQCIYGWSFNELIFGEILTRRFLASSIIDNVL